MGKHHRLPPFTRQFTSSGVSLPYLWELGNALISPHHPECGYPRNILETPQPLYYYCFIILNWPIVGRSVPSLWKSMSMKSKAWFQMHVTVPHHQQGPALMNLDDQMGSCRDKGWMRGRVGASCLSCWQRDPVRTAWSKPVAPQRGQAQGPLIHSTPPLVPTGSHSVVNIHQVSRLICQST